MIKDLCFDAASVFSRRSPGLLWKKLRLLPDSKSSVNTSSICLLGNGRIVPDTIVSLNDLVYVLVIHWANLSMS